MNLYEEEQVEVITDIYGVGCEVNRQCRKALLQKALARVGGKYRLVEKVRVKGRSGGILQVVHCEGNIYTEDVKATSEGLKIAGILVLKILHITGEDEMPYASVEEQIPFQYTMEVPGLEETDHCSIQSAVEQIQVQLLDGEEMEVKANLGFQTTAFRPVPVELMEDIEAASLDPENWNRIPGMVIYIVKPGDTLWNIGRRYYIPVEQIKKLNGLESDMLQIGQRLFLIKGGFGEY